MEKRNINILGISKIKLLTNNDNFAFKEHPNYKCFFSSKMKNTYGSGVAIIMNKKLAKHVTHLIKIDEHILAVNMLFKNSKICIIQIYLPNDKTASNKYQRILRRLISNECKTKTKIILISNFKLIDRNHNK